MWFSRSGLPDPAALSNYLAAGQRLRYWGRHLISKVEQVEHQLSSVKSITFRRVTHCSSVHGGGPHCVKSRETKRPCHHTRGAQLVRGG